jgi:hypothetical protein
MTILRPTACLVFTMLVGACGSSNIVEPTTPLGLEAVHFDQLLGSACLGAGGPRCDFLSTFALSPAFGAAPSPVSFDSGAGPFVWQAFVFDVADSSASSHTVADNLTFMAFSDTNVSSGVVVTVPAASSASRLYDTTSVDFAANSAISDSTGAAQGACAKPPTLRHTTVPSVSGASCTIRSFTMGFTLNFMSGVTFTVMPQNLNGIRILRVNP